MQATNGRPYKVRRSYVRRHKISTELTGSGSFPV